MRFLVGIVIDADDETDARDFANQLQAGIRSARAAGRTPILGIVQGPTVSLINADPLPSSKSDSVLANFVDLG